MPTVEVNLTIDARVEDVWRAVNNIEAFPQFMDNVQRVEILSDDGRERRSLWSVLLKGSVLEWSERELVDPAANRIEFEQLDGDLDLFSGHWQLCEKEGGTDATLVVDFEIGIPLLADMLNPVAAKALRDNSIQMLREIEREVRPVATSAAHEPDES